MGGVLIAAVCYVLSTTAIMGMILTRRYVFQPLRSVMPHAWRWVTPQGQLSPSVLRPGVLVLWAAGRCLPEQTAKAAADDGLFPPILPA